MFQRSLPPNLRARGVTAILGPTNTGKTWYAIERMVAHPSGMIGLPLRLLAREVYHKVAEKVGVSRVALITGEEKIRPDNARYWVCTVEAMPRDLQPAFVAVDEIQLAADLDRGHVFTDRLLNQRGTDETLLLGSSAMAPLVEALIPGSHIISRPRLSKLTYSGARKLSRLPPRSAVVAFSVEDVYETAEWIRRQKGGAAVVLGALSPRTRNAQVELFQSGEVDYIVATDAIGMGLNLDVRHVAFAGDRKFDGFRFRNLYPLELAQIAGRAGRHLEDGTFGTTGRCPFFDEDTIEAIEEHRFDPFYVLQWRNPDLDFSSLAMLQTSLERTPREHGLTRAPFAEDVIALETLARDDGIRAMTRTASAVECLWDVCRIPDYRKVSPQAHAELIRTVFQFICDGRGIPNDWFKRQISSLNRTDGDMDTLSNRISQVRTWSFIANHPDWLRESAHWQTVTRQVEDSLSDALHERLAQRFIDRRTSVLLRRLRENKMLEAEISPTGEVVVEGQNIGTLSGFVFTPDSNAAGEEARVLRQAAQNALVQEIQARAARLAETADSNLLLSLDGIIRWLGTPVARLEPGLVVLEPGFRLICDDSLNGAELEKVHTRVAAWLKAHIGRLLEPLLQLREAADLEGIARGLAFQLYEGLGILERAKVLQDVRNLEQDSRAALRKLGVRFGAYHLFLPAVLKPAPRLLITQLWALMNGGLEQKGLAEIAPLAGSGRTSFPLDPDIPVALYRAAGFRPSGSRVLRIDILERLADLIRPAIAYRPGETPGEPPTGAADGDGFVPTVAMTSLVGCAGEEFAGILKSLGYVSESRPGPAITVPLLAAAATTPVSPPAPVLSEEPGSPVTTENEPASAGDATQSEAAIAGPAAAQPDEPEPAVAAESETASTEEAAQTGTHIVEPVAAQSVEPEPANNGSQPVENAEKTEESPAEPAVTADPVESAATAVADAPESAAAETAAPETTPTGTDAPVLEAPPLIEVWHQHRRPLHSHDRSQRSPEDRKRFFRHRHKARDDDERRAPAAAGERPPRPDRRPPAASSGERPERPERPIPADRPQRADRPERGDRSERPRFDRRKDGGKPNRFRGRDKDRDRSSDWHDRPYASAGGSREPNLDSPFAKLLALKEQLKDDKS
ncbi:MAG: helicase [Methylobacteriaceae bacterium]|jgi:ATP-dependent RNA helicase SUPV3L1/SUV3|nr:helicase [Methylobacteriaceae bacterium]